MSCPFAQQSNQLPELTGDLQALKLVDLERHGLSAYRSQVGSGAQQQQQSSSSRYTAAQSPAAFSAAASATRSYRQSAAAGQQQQQSNVEQQVINAKQPIQFSEKQQIQAGQYRGIHLNRQEEAQFQGPVPLTQYKFNEDPNPEVIRKRLDRLKYQQEVAVKYLQPPSPPKPGDLIIKEKQSRIPPAPPVVLRQEAPQASTPTPKVLRERPPRAPCAVPQQVIEVDGAPVPPPARRVVLEKLTSLPPKPQNVIIEKWLPYRAQKRRVIFQKACGQAAKNPRNLIIEWEAPQVEVEKVCKNLGVEQADPEEYIRRYGAELQDNVPSPCGEAPCPPPARTPTPAPPQQCGCEAPRTPTPAPCQQRQPSPAPCQQRQPSPAPCQQRQPTPACNTCGNGSEAPELVGDIQALKLVNLEQHGLGAYRRYVQ